MTVSEFKEMCRQLKVFPIVVTEETADKITVFCAKKASNLDQDGQGSSNQACFEFMDFIRAFKVRNLSNCYENQY